MLHVFPFFSIHTGLCFSIQIITVMLTQEHRLDIISLVKPHYAFHTNFYIFIHKRALHKSFHEIQISYSKSDFTCKCMIFRKMIMNCLCFYYMLFMIFTPPVQCRPPSVISIASRVCFSLGALITPAGSAFMFQLSYPSAYAVPGPARQCHVPQVTMLV